MGSTPVFLAVTGGIGAGKSAALGAFARHGAATLASDEVVHRLLRDDDEIRAALVARWGNRVLDADGCPDRAAIAGVVFAESAELAWLEALLHPRVRREYERWRDDVSALPDPPAVAVVEIPLLYETGSEERFDAVVVITAPAEVRAARSRVRLDERGKRLISDEEKVRRARYAYTNDGTLEQLDAFVRSVLAALGGG